MKPLPWLIFLTFSSAEWQACRSLLRQGIEAYYPWFFDDARRGRWSQPVGRPQFPGYLFAKVSASGIDDVISRSPGIRSVLRNAGRIIELTDDQFSEIRARCDLRHHESLPKPDEIRTVSVGDVIEIPRGPFMGAPAIIRTIDKNGRIEAQLGAFTVSFDRTELTVSAHTEVYARLQRKAETPVRPA